MKPFVPVVGRLFLVTDPDLNGFHLGSVHKITSIAPYCTEPYPAPQHALTTTYSDFAFEIRLASGAFTYAPVVGAMVETQNSTLRVTEVDYATGFCNSALGGCSFATLAQLLKSGAYKWASHPDEGDSTTASKWSCRHNRLPKDTKCPVCAAFGRLTTT